jgi:hypothetical protein
MNKAATTNTKPTPAAQKLLITDAQAILAWADRMDEAAGRWLCEKYRPLSIVLAARYLASPIERETVADASLQEALIILAGEPFVTSAARCIAQVTIRTCTARNRASRSNSANAPAPLPMAAPEQSLKLAA